MKKSKVNTLQLNKSTISRFRAHKVVGGDRISTGELCLITGVADGCIISDNCQTNGCGGTGGGGTNNGCESAGQLICSRTCDDTFIP